MSLDHLGCDTTTASRTARVGAGRGDVNGTSDTNACAGGPVMFAYVIELAGFPGRLGSRRRRCQRRHPRGAEC